MFWKNVDMRTQGISYLFMLNPHLSPSVDSQMPATHRGPHKVGDLSRRRTT